MIKYLTLILFVITFNVGISQTLQTVTDNGNMTTNSVTIGTGHNGAKLNVNAIGLDANGSTDVSVLVSNYRYNSTHSSGDNRIAFGWANHWAAAIGAYKETPNTTGLKFFTEWGFNVPNERMRITANGSVGIGTSSPSAILHVSPALDATSAIRIGAPNTSGNINVPLKSSTGGYNIDFYTWRDIQVDQIGARIRAERINDFAANSALVQAMDLTFSTSTGFEPSSLSEKMRINSAGNVGIGTASPKEKLSVNGKIRAHEVKVEVNNWPDFVFAKDYVLPTLQETEKHIKERGHLAGIPSAAEVEKNGIELGEMNKQLLQKIEELTLYLIEVKKQNDLLLIRVQKLENADKHIELTSLKN